MPSGLQTQRRRSRSNQSDPDLNSLHLLIKSKQKSQASGAHTGMSSPVLPVEAAVRSHGRDGRVLPEVEDLGGQDRRLVDEDAEWDVPDLRDLLG